MTFEVKMFIVLNLIYWISLVLFCGKCKREMLERERQRKRDIKWSGISDGELWINGVVRPQGDLLDVRYLR